MEPRFAVDLLVRIWGMGANGRPFFQNVHASNISSQGAKLSGIEHQLKPGEVIGVQLGDKKARVRVIWVIDAGALHKIQAGVRMLEGQQCPWDQELKEAEKPVSRVTETAASGQDKRRFARHKVPFPIELRDDRGGATMRTRSTDVSGRGCYIETLMPLPRGTGLVISFWIGAEKINTTGIVRTSDGGVGMGIEFTGLDSQTQDRLQQLVESMAKEPTASEAAKNSS